MSNCTNCEPCESVYSDIGCSESVPLGCTTYDGPDINIVNIKQSNKDTGRTAIQKLASAYQTLANLRVDTDANSVQYSFSDQNFTI